MLQNRDCIEIQIIVVIMKRFKLDNKIKRPYTRPEISKISIDRQISLLMDSTIDPPTPPSKSSTEEEETESIWD